MSVYVSPRTERRRRGRAIRKARREQATAALTRLDAFHAIDWTAVGRVFGAMADTLVAVIDAALVAAEAVARTFIDVVRQLTRYAAFPEIHELLLVTTKAIHHNIPTELAGKPVVLCSLVGAAL